jgi:hypothetical protein
METFRQDNVPFLYLKMRLLSRSQHRSVLMDAAVWCWCWWIARDLPRYGMNTIESNPFKQYRRHLLQPVTGPPPTHPRIRQNLATSPAWHRLAEEYLPRQQEPAQWPARLFDPSAQVGQQYRLLGRPESCTAQTSQRNAGSPATNRRDGDDHRLWMGKCRE